MIENSYLLMSPNAAYERRRWVIIVLDNAWRLFSTKPLSTPFFFFFYFSSIIPQGTDLNDKKGGKKSKLINSH